MERLPQAIEDCRKLYTLISGDNYIIGVDKSPSSVREILLSEPDHSIVEGSEAYLRGKYQLAYERRHAILLFEMENPAETALQIILRHDSYVTHYFRRTQVQLKKTSLRQLY
jgi:hypothetical protein